MTYPWPPRPGCRVMHRLSAAPIATVPSPAGLPRLRQEVLPRVPANPRILIYPHSHRLNHHSRRPPSSFPLSRESTSPRSNGGTTGGLRTGNPPSVLPHSHLPTIPLHHPSSASCRPGTAPPAVLLPRVYGPPPPTPLPRTPPRHCGESRNPGPYVAPGRCTDSPSLMKVANLTR